MERLPICLVGCGGMGNRHILGMAALAGTGISNIDLVAVCDLRADYAERAAAEAERVLGRRPRVHLGIEAAIADPGVAAFDVCTEVAAHLPVALPALAARKPVLCEKPLALTVRGARAMIDAAWQNGTILATAENYRRDPPNRLAKAVIDAGLLGHIHMMVQFSAGGSDRIIITPWRHMRERGGIGVDVVVHYTDIIQYYLGEFESVQGFGFIAEPIRYSRNGASMPHPAYQQQQAEMPEKLEATAEDSMVAIFRMKSGVLVQLGHLPSGPGHDWYQRSVHGRLGSLHVPHDRRGGAPVLRRADGELSGKQLMKALPDFELDDVASPTFARDGVEYDLPFVTSDAGQIANELYDFARAVLGNS
ncbi:MAG: Gfo/Idh/MocA family oxidoreductase, partial [Acetobacteraceae bacterium]|nr:Gfo/Idh/MocA family oxidoreductase [Acetobacteraceae bacterium]